MDYIHQIIGKKGADINRIRGILDESIYDKDVFCKKGIQRLLDLGLKGDEPLMLLAFHKSSVKYGYDLSFETLSHLFHLAKERYDKPLQRIFKSPFLIVKTCWLYEHAPYFHYYNKDNREEIDGFILDFSERYVSQFLDQKVVIDGWTKIKKPKRTKAVTFWENKIFDPVSMIERVRNDNLEGLELSIDFHPFNYTKLLPEEIGPEKRKEIVKACRKSGIKIDIHSPIVGPYSPYPDPKKGKQLFYDPIMCHNIISETIEFAKDIEAGSVVVHLIDDSDTKELSDLVMHAAGSNVRVTIENYCQTHKRQDSEFFIRAVEKILKFLPAEVRKRNFGITFDGGHFNIEGEDPLIAAERIGRWCKTNQVFLRLHATDNYGKLLFSPPAYSADVHGNVSGRGINNEAIIKLLRSMGHRFDVVAEQIKPLTYEDIDVIDRAQTIPMKGSYETLSSRGLKRLSKTESDALITPEVITEGAYQFLAGLEGIPNLKEHLVYRMIQDKKYLSVDEVRRISLEFMKMTQTYKNGIIDYIDELLLPIQSENGAIQKNELDLICQNITGSLFGTINTEHLDQIFSQSKKYNKDDIVCEQDAIGKEMYLIKEGEISVLIDGIPLAVLGPGEIFGEISLFYNVKRTATVKAERNGTLLGILTRGAFESLLKRSEPFTYDLIYRLYNILPDRLRNLNDKYRMAIDALKLIIDGEEVEKALLSYAIKEKRPESVFFPEITPEESREIFKDLKEYDEGRLIFAEGDIADGAYYIVEGKVKAVTFSSDHKEIELGELVEGEVFGEMALIDNKTRSASVSTITPCRLAFIDNKRFNEFMESSSELSFRLMGFICLSIFWRILRLDKIYADIKKAFR
jgi:CRP-like cAMP-binding protein/sugar phosphate isomerase/epimerase